MPDFRLERAHGGRVAGVDEAGRGPLAGPVVAAAVVFASGVPRALRRLIDDSKKLTPEARQAAYAALLASGAAEIGIGAASVVEIGRLNILHASMLAMSRALSRLGEPPALALIDGNCRRGLEAWETRCVIDGDAKSFSIAAASIVAKVVRDRAMARLACRWPGYGWESNAGYATRPHRAGLVRLGPTRHHRSAFGSVRALLGQHALDFDQIAGEVGAGVGAPIGVPIAAMETGLDAAALEGVGPAGSDVLLPA